jgi:putative glutamine amidotransferase
MNHRYFTALTYVGAAPVMIPLLDDSEPALRAIFDRLDGLFIAGGVDMDPSSYGGERTEHCGNTDLPRDRVEMLLARWAVEADLPMLGVCRGMQVMNVVAGGSLHQDCADEIPTAGKHDYFPTQGHARDYIAHDVEVASGSRLAATLGEGRVGVNSMHHQAVRRLGDGLQVTAVAPDGVIEAIEDPRRAFHVGVQWHPEMLVEKDAGTRRLFEAFVEAARARRRVGDMPAAL